MFNNQLVIVTIALLCRSWRVREGCPLTITVHLSKRLWSNRWFSYCLR